MDEEPLKGEFFIDSGLCQDAAPVVANGGFFICCMLTAGHEGQHYVEIRWH